jgi:hypothetical protein
METTVPRIPQHFQLVFLAVLSAGILGCTASTGNVSTELARGHPSAPFSSILVIGVADNYEGRAKFERKLASELRAAGTTATALYVAAGGNKPIEREAIEALVQANGYDAVLISRVLNRNTDASMKAGSSASKAVRKDGGGIDLFRYDYEELNEPTTWNVELSVTISTELFAASDSQRVWAIESSISDKDYVEDVINEAADIIVRRLNRDRLIRN